MLRLKKTLSLRGSHHDSKPKGISSAEFDFAGVPPTPKEPHKPRKLVKRNMSEPLSSLTENQLSQPILHTPLTSATFSLDFLEDSFLSSERSSPDTDLLHSPSSSLSSLEHILEKQSEAVAEAASARQRLLVEANARDPTTPIVQGHTDQDQEGQPVSERRMTSPPVHTALSHRSRLRHSQTVEPPIVEEEDIDDTGELRTISRRIETSTASRLSLQEARRASASSVQSLEKLAANRLSISESSRNVSARDLNTSPDSYDDSHEKPFRSSIESRVREKSSSEEDSTPLITNPTPKMGTKKKPRPPPSSYKEHRLSRSKSSSGLPKHSAYVDQPQTEQITSISTFPNYASPFTHSTGHLPLEQLSQYTPSQQASASSTVTSRFRSPNSMPLDHGEFDDEEWHKHMANRKRDQSLRDRIESLKKRRESFMPRSSRNSSLALSSSSKIAQHADRQDSNIHTGLGIDMGADQQPFFPNEGHKEQSIPSNKSPPPLQQTTYQILRLLTDVGSYFFVMHF